MAELITYYVISALLFVGAPAIFFIIAFMPALQNTKGRMVGYKDHKQYGDISLYEVKRWPRLHFHNNNPAGLTYSMTG